MKKKLNDYTYRKYNVAWLKAKLQEALDNLEYFEDEDEIDIAQNTYWVGPNFISFGSIGFVDLENPVKEKEEEEEEFEDSIPEKEQGFIYSVEGMINGKVFQHKHEDLQVAKKDFDRTSEKIKEIDNSYVELWNIQEDKLLTMFDPETKMTHDAKGESIYQVMVMHQDYSETLHFITAKSIDQLEYKIGKIDPYYIDYSIISKEQTIKDGMSELEMALKMEKDTIAQYQNYARRAGDGDNPETQLWEHLIKEEEEHVKEIEAAMKGDYSEIIHDAGNDFQQSVDGVAKLLRKAKLQENVSFSEGDQSFKTVLVETPKDKFDEVLKVLKEEYEIDSHNGKNRIFVKIKDAVKISVKSPEQVMKEQERDEEFSDRINDCLVDGGLDHRDYRISNEDIHFYVDFDSKEEEAVKAYELLRDSFFKCDLVEDEGFFYVHVIRR